MHRVASAIASAICAALVASPSGVDATVSRSSELAVKKGAARDAVAALRERREPVPGYGHPQHKSRDPRVARLFEVSRQAGGDQRYVAIAEAVEAAIPSIYQRELRLNVSAAIPAVLLGVGFPVAALKGVPILARTAGLIAHLAEELEQPAGFALSYQATKGYEYTGELPPGFAHSPDKP